MKNQHNMFVCWDFDFKKAKTVCAVCVLIWWFASAHVTRARLHNQRFIFFSVYIFVVFALKMTDNSMIQQKISYRRITQNCIRFCFSRNRYQFAFTVRGTLPYTHTHTHVARCANMCVKVWVLWHIRMGVSVCKYDSTEPDEKQR